MNIKHLILDIFSSVHYLQEAFKDKNKKFILEGRLVDDLGEALAEEYFQIKLLKKLVKPYNAKTEINNTGVLIKCTMKDFITYPIDYHPDLFLGLHITPSGNLIELYNGETKPIENYLKGRKKPKNSNYYIITNRKLLMYLNGLSDKNSEIKKRKNISNE